MFNPTAIAVTKANFTEVVVSIMQQPDCPMTASYAMTSIYLPLLFPTGSIQPELFHWVIIRVQIAEIAMDRIFPENSVMMNAKPVIRMIMLRLKTQTI